ncbi:universal stress protein [Reyranella sp.]|uniref:universal stress protein n=1 Tax=Reyranella sp. TaxID=1929291 RepID=UPI003D115B6A
MSFRNILVVLRAYPAGISVGAVSSAVEIAAALAPRVSAIACAVKPRVPRSILGNALLDVSAMVGEEYRKSEHDAERLLEAFEEAAKRHRVFGERILRTCRPFEVPDALAGCSRLRDLTIVPMPQGEHVSQFDAQWDVETILFQSGHPAIVVPADAIAPAAFDTVIVAWDKSRAAARAIADAMPILQTAKHVRILTVIGEKPIEAHHAGAELAHHLGFHGVDCVVDEVNADGRSIGDVLQAQVDAHDAGLLVMGAYGHSRLREFVLGGATRGMLSKPPTALFLSH